MTAALLAFVAAIGTADRLIPPPAAFADAVRDAVARVEPSVVTIETVGGTQPMFDALGQPIDTSSGQMPSGRVRGGGFTVADGPTTGLIFSADGLILTSSFNFVRNPMAASVKLADGRSFVGKLVARDRVRKLALLRIDADDLPVPEWATRSDIHGGETAIALGRGFGGQSSTVSVGIVSATNRIAGQAIQTDAKLSPANYGGPLIDLEGRVIGLCVPMGLQPGELVGVEWYDSGIGFAIPRDVIDAVAPQLSAGESIERGWIGISMFSDFLPGALIVRIADNSPAEELELQIGDRIIAVDGQPVGSTQDMMRRMNCRAAGETVTLVILRQLHVMVVDVPLAVYSELDFSKTGIDDNDTGGAEPTDEP